MIIAAPELETKRSDSEPRQYKEEKDDDYDEEEPPKESQPLLREVTIVTTTTTIPQQPAEEEHEAEEDEEEGDEDEADAREEVLEVEGQEEQDQEVDTHYFVCFLLRGIIRPLVEIVRVRLIAGKLTGSGNKNIEDGGGGASVDTRLGALTPEICKRP